MAAFKEMETCPSGQDRPANLGALYSGDATLHTVSTLTPPVWVLIHTLGVQCYRVWTETKHLEYSVL